MDWFGITILYAIALLLLLADFFLPSHGILTVAALGLLTYAIYLTFGISQEAGLISLAAVAVVVPVSLVIAIRTWHRTPMGRKISPPNPVLGEADRLPVQDIETMIGKVGRTLTPLRPVGMAVFDGHRIECCSEHGMIPANVPVEGVRRMDRTLLVRQAQ